MLAMSQTAQSTGVDAEVLIVGAGPAGLALACALGDAGLSVRVLEQNSLDAVRDPAPDGRDIALTHRARRVMEELGLWQQIAPSDVAVLNQARVEDGGRAPVLRVPSEPTPGSPLGWLVPNYLIRRAAWQAVALRPSVQIEFDAPVRALSLQADQAGVTLADGRRLSAHLVVAADSRFSQTRRQAGIGASMRDFGRTVVVGRVAHTLDNGGIAWECFQYGNTLALLPLNGREVSAVVTIPTDRAPEWLALSDEAFAARVESHSKQRLGTLRSVGPRYQYPLVAVYAHRFAVDRLALIGDAAVGMHPVTAHGWNFGLYGVQVLARELRAARSAGRDIGAMATLAGFEREHRRATLPVYLGTNAVVSLFTDDRAAPRWARQAVLAIAEGLPPFNRMIKSAIEHQLVQSSVGFPWGLPAPPWRRRAPVQETR